VCLRDAKSDQVKLHRMTQATAMMAISKPCKPGISCYHMHSKGHSIPAVTEHGSRGPAVGLQGLWTLFGCVPTWVFL